MDLLFPILTAVCGIGGLIVALAVYFSTRKSDEGTLKIAKRVEESDRLSALNEALGRDLDRNQRKIEDLEAIVDRGKQKANQLEEQVNVALANVGILLRFIDEQVPFEIARPRLREVPNGR